MLSPRGRKLKQTNIALGFFTLLLGIAALIWYLVAPPSPAKELKNVEIKSINSELKNDEKPWEAPFTYTVVVTIQNPNQDFIVKELDWTMEVKNENNETIVQEKGTEKMKENEEKKIQKDITLDQQGKTVSFKINRLVWTKNTTQ